MKAWYALHTKPNAETRVANTLIARGFTMCAPMLPARPNGISVPLFPTYLFVQCDLAAEGAAQMRWIPGLRRIISFDGVPAVVPEDAITLIREQLAQLEAAGGLPAHAFKPGDEVVVDQGPLAGLRGVFQGPPGPAERVYIFLQFLGQANRAEVPVEMLRHAPEEGGAANRRGTRGRGRRIAYKEVA